MADKKERKAAAAAEDPETAAADAAAAPVDDVVEEAASADAAAAAVDDVVGEPSVAEGESEADAGESEAEADAGEPEVQSEAEPEAAGASEAEVEGDAGDAPAAPAAPPKPEPVAVVTPKERRRLKRAAKEPAARGPLSAEDRQAERDALRAKNAKARRHGREKSRAAKPASAAAPPAAVEHAVGRPRDRQGIVVSDKAAKTITVRVDTSRRHRRYKKIVRSSKTLHAHDEHNEAHEGDLVRVVETRPLSATKRWRLLEVLERAK